MDVLNPPPQMNFNSANAADEWDCWEVYFCNYLKVVEMNKKEKDVQVAILLEVAGPDALTIHKTFQYELPQMDGDRRVREGEDPLDYDVILRKFAQYCKPCKNNIYERYRFCHRDQEDESVDQRLVDLRTQAALCEFRDQEELLLRDKIVFGLRDERAKERLLREGEASLQRAIDTCHAADTGRRQVEGMKNPSSTSTSRQVHAVARREQQRQQKNRNPGPTTTSGTGQQSSSNQTKMTQLNFQKQATCSFSGKKHAPCRSPSIWQDMCQVWTQESLGSSMRSRGNQEDTDTGQRQ